MKNLLKIANESPKTFDVAGFGVRAVTGRASFTVLEAGTYEDSSQRDSKK
jgi:hypothetical protein